MGRDTNFDKRAVKFRKRRHVSTKDRQRSSKQGKTDHKQRPSVTLKYYSARGDIRRRAGKHCAKKDAQ
jgi:hypothetical protein